MNATEELLRRLAADDEGCLYDVAPDARCLPGALDRETRALVQLSALLAADAATATLRWAVEVASTSGVDEGALVQVLLTAASVTGAAQTVRSAPRLALALDMDLEVDGWDGT